MCLTKTKETEIEQDPLDTDCFKTEFEDDCDYLSLEETQDIKLTVADLVVLQLNCRGLISKQKDLSQFLFELLGENKVDIVILIETWLTPESVKRLSVPGYSYYGKTRKNRKGGGVGFLISEGLSFKLREDLISINTVTENCHIELLDTDKKIIVSALYRPPNTDVNDFLLQYNSIFNKLPNYDVIVGVDHNLNLLKYYEHSGTRNFMELLIDLEHYPCLTRPTRITHHSATLIDNIFVSKRLHCMQHSGIVTCDLSDHLPGITIFNRIKAKTIVPKTKIKRNLSTKKLAKIVEKLHEIDFTFIEEGTDIDQVAELFHNEIVSTIDMISPEREITVSTKHTHSEPWITKGLRKCATKQLKLYRTFLSHRSVGSCEKYKQYRSAFKKIKRRAKQDYYFEKCIEFKSNTKKLWQMINNITGQQRDKTCIIESLKIDNLVINDKTAIANTMCKYFSSIGMTYANRIQCGNTTLIEYLNKIKRNEKSIYMYPTNQTEVRTILNNLASKSSSGWDGISNKLLKAIKDPLVEPLAKIFNLSIKQGKFPSLFKLADVIPLFKSGMKTEKNNYRPISLLVTMSKILEKIIYKRVYDFLNTTNQIYQSQYGFRTKHSCEHAVQELLGKILKGYENSQYTAAVFLDLSKAFDSLEHETLLRKLDIYGVRGIANNWFESYLCDRNIRVKCNTGTSLNTYSDYNTVNYGVPQGSCLGPLLFLTFCNDLPLNLTFCNAILFADDTTLYKSNSNLRYLEWCICEELKQLSDWFKANKLTLNLGKSCCILFDRGKDVRAKFELNIENVTIPIKECTKFLGVWIDRKLSWGKHVDTIVLKIKRNMHLLRTSRNLLNHRTKKLILYAHVVSHINYCLSVWGNMINEQQKNRLENILRKCVVLVTNTSEHSILSVKNMITLGNYKFGYKLVKELLPPAIMECTLSDHSGKSLRKSHQYQTRAKNIPNYPNIKYKKYKDSIFCKGPMEFSSLTKEVRDANTLSYFVKCCKKLLLTSN